MRIMMAISVIAHIAASQTVYELPFASQGHEVALVVANTSAVKMEGVKVEVREAPQGIRFTEGVVAVGTLAPKGEQEVVFRFSVEKTAKVNTKQTIAFTVTDTTGQRWRKEVVVRVSPPERFEVYQNYPNPFNPVTVIGYQVPKESRVVLVVYDLRGREVVRRECGVRMAGYYEEQLDGVRMSSGVYVYGVEAQAVDGSKVYHAQKKMVVLK